MDQLATTRIALVDVDGARRARIRALAEAEGNIVDVIEGAAIPEAADVIIIDGAHPRISVASLVSDLRARGSDALVLAVASDSATAAAALRAGAYDICKEPLERACFEGALRRARERQELARKLRALQVELARAGGEEVVPLRELERRAIEKALAATRGSVEKAARMLGMGRATLYRRLATMATSRPA
jgi:DNA-binding NtrC family response regulator